MDEFKFNDSSDSVRFQLEEERSLAREREEKLRNDLDFKQRKIQQLQSDLSSLQKQVTDLERSADMNQMQWQKEKKEMEKQIAKNNTETEAKNEQIESLSIPWQENYGELEEFVMEK